MLLSKNINVNKRRTSMRLDQQSWTALKDICEMENISLNYLCSLIDSKRGKIGLSTATRVFLVSYLRNAIKNLKAKKPDHSQLMEVLSIVYARKS